jgi:uncharacterized membrane protein YozB (DUF420 family)
MDGRIWIAGFVSATCIDACPDAVERLAILHDGLPGDIPLVTFVVDGKSLWPTRPSAAQDRRRWTVCQGNSVDADDEEQVRRLATEFLRVAEETLNGLKDRAPAAVIVPVDRRGRPQGVYHLDDAAVGKVDPVVAAAWGDTEFLVTLHRHGRREVRLNALVAALLLAGYVLIRYRLIPAHLTCMGLAGLITMILVGLGLGYVDFATSVPMRGVGWARPSYFAVLLGHTILLSLSTLAALTLVYLALRRRFESHKAIARWIAPAWIGVCVAGVAIHYLLELWFPAG